MKYITLILLALVTTSAQADFWDNCTANGGTIITANSYSNDKGGLCNDPSNPNLTNNCNGKRFCKSNNGMNWWTSFVWCESIGGKLATFSSVCPAIQTNHNPSSGACPNLTNIIANNTNTWNWTNMGWKQNAAIAINLSTGGVGLGNFGYGSTDSRNTRLLQQPALCEE